MSGRSAFFATKQDCLDLLGHLEKKSPLLYIRSGTYPTAEAPTYESASDIPDLGVPEYGFKGCNRYIVVLGRDALTFAKGGGGEIGTFYEPIPQVEAPYVHFHSGGIYHGEALITGCIETAADGKALHLFHRFYRSLRARFHRAGTGYRSLVGPEAVGLLQAGMRATDSVGSPGRLDFKLPRRWRPPEPNAAAGSGA